MCCAALEIFSAAITPKLGEDAVRDFATTFSPAFPESKKSSTGEHAVLDSIVPATCPGQPELARKLLHAVVTGTTASAAAEHDDATEELAVGAVHASHARVSPSALEKHGKHARLQGAAVAGGAVSESDDEEGGSDGEVARRRAMEEPDEAVREHLHGPRCVDAITAATECSLVLHIHSSGFVKGLGICLWFSSGQSCFMLSLG